MHVRLPYRRTLFRENCAHWRPSSRSLSGRPPCHLSLTAYPWLEMVSGVIEWPKSALVGRSGRDGDIKKRTQMNTVGANPPAWGTCGIRLLRSHRRTSAHHCCGRHAPRVINQTQNSDAVCCDRTLMFSMECKRAFLEKNMKSRNHFCFFTGTMLSVGFLCVFVLPAAKSQTS